VPPEVWLELLPKRPFLEHFYLRMLKSEGSQEELQKYMEITKRYTDLAYLSLAQQIKEGPLQEAKDIVHDHYSKMLPSLAGQLARCQPRSNLLKLRQLRQKSTPLDEEDVS
jgi:hypothetical protein